MPLQKERKSLPQLRQLQSTRATQQRPGVFRFMGCQHLCIAVFAFQLLGLAVLHAR